MYFSILLILSPMPLPAQFLGLLFGDPELDLGTRESVLYIISEQHPLPFGAEPFSNCYK